MTVWARNSHNLRSENKLAGLMSKCRGVKLNFSAPEVKFDMKLMFIEDHVP